VHLKRSAAIADTALLLIKPRVFLDEVCIRMLWHARPSRTEMIAEEVKAAFDPADEGFVFVLLQTESSARMFVLML
jgi:hypothetical protein